MLWKLSYYCRNVGLSALPSQPSAFAASPVFLEVMHLLTSFTREICKTGTQCGKISLRFLCGHRLSWFNRAPNADVPVSHGLFISTTEAFSARCRRPAQGPPVVPFWTICKYWGSKFNRWKLYCCQLCKSTTAILFYLVVNPWKYKL